MAYLSELHPEVYLVTPRVGGLANITSPHHSSERRASVVSGKSKGDKTSLAGRVSMKSQGQSSIGGTSRTSARSSVVSSFDQKFLTSTPESNREYRINQVLHSSGWMLPDDDDEYIPMPNDPLSNVLIILSIAVSTIMLLAVGHKDISKEHLRWTLSYLECVKDEYGNYPPNVRGIMNQIKLIDDTLESYNETEVMEGGMLDAGTDAVIPDIPASAPPPGAAAEAAPEAT